MSNNTVSVSNLTVKFDDFIAVNNISFSVKTGEIFGFLGANEAGKTTTIRVLCGLLHPSSGQVSVGDTPFLNRNDEMIIKRKVGYMSQRFTLYNDLTVEENLSFIASLRGLDQSFYKKRRDLLLKFISFKEALNTPVQDLPGGIKQQVSLVAALLHDPSILFLDEPTAGVAPNMRDRFWELIQQIAKQGKTVFITTHYMDEAEHCERIALMKTGEIVALDSPNNLKKSTFPKPLYEFSPREAVTYEMMKNLGQYPEFDFFEPYGLRFHVSFKKSLDLAKLKKAFKINFDIKEIIPTLEDVFIKIIEGKAQ